MKIWLWVLFEGSCKLKGSTDEAFCVELTWSMRKDWFKLELCCAVKNTQLVLKSFSTSPFSSLSESFFMVKGAALFLQQGGSTQGPKTPTHHKHAGGNTQTDTLFVSRSSLAQMKEESYSMRRLFSVWVLFLCLSWKERSDLRTVTWAEVTGLSR